jgi:hypothetical protein
LRHVLEHVRDPVEFLSEICDANGGRGKIYIEVPCFDWICATRAWFDIFYEHVNYFRLSDFYGMFGVVYEAGHTFGGQYLYVVADLATLRMPAFAETKQLEFPADFLDTVHSCAARLNRANRQSGGAIWGGASKGVIFALFMERAGAKVDVVVDINPAKQGKYLAGTGLQVWSPGEAMRRLSSGSDIFVMNSNYLDEIREITEHRFNYLPIDQETLERK